METIQVDMSRFKKRKPERGIYTGLQLATKEVWEYCNKDKPFAFYLGIVKRIGVDRARYILSNLKDRQKPADHPGKMFVWMVKNNK